MSRTSFLAAARARTESVQFSDTCTARRESGKTYDDATGATVPAFQALYDGPCRFKQPGSTASSTTVGEADVLLQSPELHLPMDATPLLRPGDEVTIVSSVTDPVSVGRVFRVRAVPAYANATARRYGVTERSS